MIRFLNILALSAVIASATWAYSVKYETILVSEKFKKRETELRRERDAIQVLGAEWELLNRPGRLMALAKPEAGMQQLSAKQVVNARDIPAAQPAKGDSLDALLTGSLPPPTAPKATPAAGAAKPVAKTETGKKTVKKAPGDKADAKVVAVQSVPKGAKPLLLTPKANAPKANAPKAAQPAKGSAQPKAAAAPKTNAPVKLTPPAPVAASAPRREEGGLNSLFKKILN